MEYCIPHYGSTALLRAAVDSILITDPGASIYIGDDTHQLKMDWPGAVKVFSGPKKGFASNVNALVKCCRGEWIVIMNNDVALDRTWYEEMKRGIGQASGHTWSLASTMLRPNGHIDSLGDGISWYGIGYNRYHLGKLTDRRQQTAKILGPTGGLAVVRREIFLKLGGYSETLQSYCEDTQLNLRAAAAGYESFYLPKPQATHRGTSTFAMGTKFRQSARNTLLFIRTDFSGPFHTTILARATFYWRMKSVISQRYRADIRAGIKDGLTLPVPSTGQITAWPKGVPVESFMQTNWRLLCQVVYSLERKIGLRKPV